VIASTLSVICLGLTLPACCCGGASGAPPPKAGPPGDISGQVEFPSGTAPSSLAVYAWDQDRSYLDTAFYVMTRVAPPATTYQLYVPPGHYTLVARLDSDPLSAAGYPASVRVEATQSQAHIDISDWGSPAAADVLRRIDTFGSPLPPDVATWPAASTGSPSPLPVRQRPQGPLPPLPVALHLASYYYNNYSLHLDLPDGWNQIHEADKPDIPYYFVNENVQSPLSLDARGVLLVVQELGGSCIPLRIPGVTAEASFFNTQQGMAHFYFLDRNGPVGRQPFAGSEYFGTKQAGGSCLFFKFAGATPSARDSNLVLFDQIVFQARYDPA